MLWLCFLSIRVVWSNSAERLISLLSWLTKLHDFFRQHSLKFDEPCVHHKDFLPKKNKGFCRKLHFLIKTGIQCLINERHFTARWQICTFQLIHLVFSRLRSNSNLGKAFGRFQGYICCCCFYRLWKISMYVTRYNENPVTDRMIHHLLSLIQF